MRITITQRGGLAGGEIMLAQADTAQMDPNARTQVEAQVAASVTGSRSLRERPVGADLLEYRLVIDDDGRQDSITLIDDGGDGAQPIKQLIAHLQQRRT